MSGNEEEQSTELEVLSFNVYGSRVMMSYLGVSEQLNMFLLPWHASVRLQRLITISNKFWKSSYFVWALAEKVLSSVFALPTDTKQNQGNNKNTSVL